MITFSNYILQAHRAVGVKRAILSKKRGRRSATQPVTRHEVFAAKSLADRKQGKSHDDSELHTARPFRGRLLSVPTTNTEILEVKRGSPPQKYVRPKEPKAKEVKKVEKRLKSGRSMSTKNVTSKVDSGRSVLNRNSPARSSMKSIRDSKAENTPSPKGSVASLADSKSSDTSNKFSRRSASVRVSSSSTNSVRAAAERANALVDSRKTSVSSRKPPSKAGESTKTKVTAKVDSRRSGPTQVALYKILLLVIYLCY